MEGGYTHTWCTHGQKGLPVTNPCMAKRAHKRDREAGAGSRGGPPHLVAYQAKPQSNTLAFTQTQVGGGGGVSHDAAHGLRHCSREGNPVVDPNCQTLFPHHPTLLHVPLAAVRHPNEQ